MAPAVAHIAGVADTVTLLRAQLGQAVDPLGIGAKGGAGIDQARVGCARQGEGVARGLVRQTQDDNIGLAVQVTFGLRIFALPGGDPQQFDVAAILQPLVDHQPGGAFLPVDKHFMRHGAVPLPATAVTFMGSRVIAFPLKRI